MAMKAQITTDFLGNITVIMQGGLDYDSATPLRAELEKITADNPKSMITIDMDSLDFVGSSGIVKFVETIKYLESKKANIRLSNVKDEFLKVFKLYQFNALHLIISDFDNDETENLTEKFSNKKRTFQN